jgi:hypothetical protein
MTEFDKYRMEIIQEVLNSHPLHSCKLYSALQTIKDEKIVWVEDRVRSYVMENGDDFYSLINYVRNNQKSL